MHLMFIGAVGLVMTADGLGYWCHVPFGTANTPTGGLICPGLQTLPSSFSKTRRIRAQFFTRMFVLKSLRLAFLKPVGTVERENQSTHLALALTKESVSVAMITARKLGQIRKSPFGAT